jgi:hypothetical protein
MITRDGERRGRIVRRILVVVRLISSDALLASKCRGAVCKVDTVSHWHSAHDSETDRLFRVWNAYTVRPLSRGSEAWRFSSRELTVLT